MPVAGASGLEGTAIAREIEAEEPWLPLCEAVRKLTNAMKPTLQRGCACLETRPAGAPQHEVML
jgi:hypothetical protein